MQDSATISAVPRLIEDAGPPALPIRFEGVSYEAGATRILSDIELEFGRGAPTLVMGPNGSGKSTLLKLAMGLIVPTSGCITFGGADKAPPGSRAIVFQKPVMLRRSVAANIEFAARTASKAAARSGDVSVAKLLDLAHLGALAGRQARHLSGGEQQRLALARALARSPQILFLDEPTASLDPSSTKLVEEVIATIAASGVKVVMSTHDTGQARRLAGGIMFLAKGRVVEQTPAARFFTAPVSEEARRFLAGELLA